MAADMPKSKYLQALEAIRYSVDLITASLLLTGQISTVGMFLVEGGFFLTSTGPILGGERYHGKTAGAAFTLDLIDILAALLLIIDAVRVTGVYVSAGRSYLTFTGPIFGVPGIPVAKDPFARTSQPPVTEECLALRDFVKKTMLDRY